MERGTGSGQNQVHPWDVQETLQELHGRKYYPRASKLQAEKFSVERWPKVLRAAVEGKAELALSSFGAALFYLQRNLISEEILSLGIVKAYIPPESTVTAVLQTQGQLLQLATEQSMRESGIDDPSLVNNVPGNETTTDPESMEIDQTHSHNPEDEITCMSLDGTTLHNLEILTNAVDQSVAGSLWSKINFTKSPHGSRLLRAWLLRPLFRKSDIERRLDAVEELTSGSAAAALDETRRVLAKCGDIDRLLSRVHSMSGLCLPGGDADAPDRFHPNDRAILYENATYNKRKVGDFSKVLNGLMAASQIPELFSGVPIESPLLQKIVKRVDEGGCFPDIAGELQWFFQNFDCKQAAQGLFEPCSGIDELYDDACATIERVKADLNAYKNDMCATVLASNARNAWKYANTNVDSKDKYLIELPASIRVPDFFTIMGKRGAGAKQVNKYRTPEVEQHVQELEVAFDRQNERRKMGITLIFAKFDAKRALWAAASQATALLDALGALAQTASKSGYIRPRILDCPLGASPSIKIVQGRHPCVENSFQSSEFIPNDLTLGCPKENGVAPRVLLLSGPNMGVS